MIKMDKFQYFSIKSYVVDVYKVKTLVFCENFVSTETFT